MTIGNEGGEMDVNQIVTNRILEALESGVAPWRKPWQTIGGGVAKNLVSNRPYHWDQPIPVTARKRFHVALLVDI